jgi:hypothetical protein
MITIILQMYFGLSESWRVPSSGMLCRVALVRTDVSEEPGASFIRVTRIGELGTTQAATSNRLLSPCWRRCYVPPKHRFLQEPHGVTSQKTPILHSHRRENLKSIGILFAYCYVVYFKPGTCCMMCIYCQRYKLMLYLASVPGTVCQNSGVLKDNANGIENH